MADQNDKFGKSFVETIEWLEKELALPSGFIRELARENDWSFIIKTHALVEAAVTNQLAASIEPRLSTVFEQLELSDSRKGKIAFAKVLDLLDGNQRKFIRFLSELRNDLVHDVRSVSFRIDTYLSNSDANKRAAFFDAITYFAANPEGWKAKARKDPKTTILIATVILLIYSTVGANTEKRERELVNRKAKMLDDTFGK